MRLFVFAVVTLFGLAGCGGGGQDTAAAAGKDKRKLSTLEDQLEDMKADLAKEKAARQQAEGELAGAKAQIAAQQAAAKAAAAPPPGAPGAPGVPGAPGAPGAVPGMPDPNALPAAPPPPKPVAARIIEKSSSGSGARLIINAGSKRGVGKNWTGQVFLAKGTKVIAVFKVTAVREDDCDALVANMTLGALGSNDRVELIAPASP